MDDEGFETILADMLAKSEHPIHPVLEPFVPRGKIDPTARTKVAVPGTEERNISARERTIHSVVAQHSIEGLTAMLTPLGMVVVVDALLQFMAVTDEELRDGFDGINVDPWDEIAQLAPDVRDEFRRAGWHFSWALEAMLEGRPVETLRAEAESADG